MKKIWIGVAGLVLLLFIVGVALLPRITRKIKNTLLNSSPTATTAGTITDKYNPPTEVVSGSISLTISTPQDKSTVNTLEVTVTGKTTPNAEVFVNDQETKADANGSFTVKLTLDEGENPISVSVNDDQGNYAEKEITVTYELPTQPTP